MHHSTPYAAVRTFTLKKSIIYYAQIIFIEHLIFFQNSTAALLLLPVLTYYIIDYYEKTIHLNNVAWQCHQQLT